MSVRNAAAQIQGQRAFLVRLSIGVKPVFANPDVQRAHAGGQHNVRRTQAAREGQIVEVEVGLQALSPIHSQIQVDHGSGCHLQLHIGIKTDAVLRQACIQVHGDFVAAQFDTAVKRQGQSVLVQLVAQARTDTGFGCPIGVQIRLQSAQSRHAQGTVLRHRHALQARNPGRIHVAIDVALHIVAQTHHRGQVEHVVQCLVDQRQNSTVLQRHACLCHLRSHTQQGAAQAASQTDVQVGQAKAGRVGTGIKLRQQSLATDHNAFIDGLARTVELHRHVAKHRRARQAWHSDGGRG